MIKFEPVAGLTIEEAFARAIKMAKDNNDVIHTIINDIHINITSKSQVDKLVKYYRFKKRLEYQFKMGTIKESR